MSDENTAKNIDFRSLGDEEKIRIIQEQRERQATSAFGPPELRARKNREHVEQMVAQYTEPVVRKLLKVLSEIKEPEEPVFARILRKHDLDHDDLNNIIRVYDLCGPRIEISSHSGSEYHLLISGGWNLASEFWSVTIWRLGSKWSVKCASFSVA